MQSSGMQQLALPAHAGNANQSCSQSHINQSSVIAANTSYEAALLASDVKAISRILSPDYLFITSSGESRDRRELLRSYGAKEVRLKLFKSENVLVRFYGNVGILTADVTKEGDYASGPRAGTVFTGKYRFTRVFACIANNWQLVSTHESHLVQ